ncbi:MAG: AsmA family protein [Beijerinckiaceae bacterium]
MNQQLSEQTGLAATTATSDVRFTLLPFPKVTVSNLRIASVDGLALARISSADAYLRLLDLIGGRYRFNGFSLQEPIIDARSRAARDAWRRAGLALMESESEAGVSLVGHVAIANGAVLASPEPLTGVTGTIVWHGANSPLSIWGVGRWKGETSEVRLSDLRLGDYLRGRDATPFRLALSSPLARLEAEGSIFGAAPPRGEAMIKADVKSSSGLSRWLGAQAPLSGLVDRYSFEGASTFSARGFSSPSVIFTAAGSRFEGTLALRFEEQRPQISGTLATHALDFDALGVAVDSVRDEGGAWSSDRFDASLLRQSDADIRVSAGRVRLMGARIQDAAISIMLKDGRLEFVLGRSAAYQGEVRGRASLQANDDARVEARLQLHFENLDVGDAMQDIAGRKLVTGRGQGQVQLESAGESAIAVAQNLSGKLTTELRDGDLAGLNLIEAVRRPDRNATNPLDLARGRTSFSVLQTSATLANGVADVRDATLASGPVHAQASGEISIRDQFIKLEGNARAPSIPGDGLPFSLRGPLRQPDFRWDFVSALKRI